MRTHPRYWLARLRRCRRAVALAVLPAFACSTVLAAACLGMPTASAAQHFEAPAHAHVDHAGSMNTAHDSAEQLPVHADMPDCAHCPPAADSSGSPSAFCVTDNTTNASTTQPNPAQDHIKVFSHVRLTMLPAAAAAPPPLSTALAIGLPHVERTPLNIRHCVFLI